MRYRKTLKDAFLMGLIVIGPLAITILAISFVYSWLVSLITPILSILPGSPTALSQFISVVVVLTGIPIIGLLAMRDGEHEVMVYLDNVMDRIPILNIIYSGIRRASQVIATSKQSKLERVVFVEWPRENTYTMGFITAESPPMVTNELTSFDSHDEDEDVYHVLIPLSPNPMTGFFAIVPESHLALTDLSISQGIQMAVTTGLSMQDDVDVEDEYPMNGILAENDMEEVDEDTAQKDLAKEKTN